MSTTHQRRSPVTELELETMGLAKELKHLINVILNCMFSRTRKGTRLRGILLAGLLISVVALFGFWSIDDAILSGHLQSIWAYLFDPLVAQSFNTNPIQDFLQTLWETYNSPIASYYLLIFVLPFIVAWQIASIYLADIFELEHVETAQRYIFQVALWGGSDKIRIREGELDLESENSPVNLIGGPGSVIVELDSVALFERPDGQPHVIGPTVDGPIVLDGFERFRQAIDLRDHRTESMNIISRSQDGIPIQAADVSFLFSVVRGNNQVPSLQRPYPFFNSGVIESLIYEQVARVSPTGPRPADISKDWAGTMTRLIRSALGNFMSQRDLTEYLASYGVPEVQLALRQTDTVIQAAQRILPPEGPFPSLPREENPPAFIPRPDIKALLFGEFAQEFPVLASQRGVELHWVGIGSWKTPSQIIPEQHLEAWQLSLDNQARRDSGMPNLRGQDLTRLIQDVPLIRFSESLKKQVTRREIMAILLVGYREQFMKFLNITDKKRENINVANMNRVRLALQHINRILGWPNDFEARWINNPPFSPQDGGPGTRSPSPLLGPALPSGSRSETPSRHLSSSEEFALFNNLILKTRNIEVAERLIEYERELTPDESEIELIRRAIARWEKDNR